MWSMVFFTTTIELETCSSKVLLLYTYTGVPMVVVKKTMDQNGPKRELRSGKLVGLFERLHHVTLNQT
jgi:hypothetical protein